MRGKDAVVGFVCCVFLGLLSVVVAVGEREQRHRAEVAEDRADSLGTLLALSEHGHVSFGDSYMMSGETFRMLTAFGPDSVYDKPYVDSLAHLADSLRDRRTYWYWKAHAKEVH